ncbi:hypothetical protein LY76DRAFT_592075 [Colletotrichum caudatum]|nr:hypothetical protein LY76DRAFT_592075 [Colletotrichum caudatum]
MVPPVRRSRRIVTVARRGKHVVDSPFSPVFGGDGPWREALGQARFNGTTLGGHIHAFDFRPATGGLEPRRSHQARWGPAAETKCGLDTPSSDELKGASSARLQGAGIFANDPSLAMVASLSAGYTIRGKMAQDKRLRTRRSSLYHHPAPSCRPLNLVSSESGTSCTDPLPSPVP